MLLLLAALSPTGHVGHWLRDFAGALRAWRLFMAIALMVLVAAVLGYLLADRSIAQQRREIRTMARPATDAMQEIRVAFATGAYALRGYLITHDTFFIARYDDAREAESAALRRLRPLAKQLDPGVMEAITRFERMRSRWHAPISAIMTYSNVQFSARDSIYKQTLRASEAASAAINTELQQRLEDIRSSERVKLIIALGLATLFLGAAFVLAGMGARLRTTARTLQTVIGASPLGIVVHDTKGVVQIWNRAAERMLGWRADEAVGRPLPFVPPGKAVESADLLKRASRGEVMTGIEIERVRKDGSPIDLNLSVAPLSSDDGAVYRIIGMLEDIRARKRARFERERLLAAEYEARAEAERRADDEAALREATAAVSQSLTVDETTRRIARNALRATRADGAFMERIDSARGEVEVVAAAGAVSPPTGVRVKYTGSWSQLVVDRREPAVIPRLEDAELRLPELLTKRCGDCSAAVIPLVDGEAIGALILLRRANRMRFRPDELARASTFGHLAALTFRRVHQLEVSERQLDQLQRVTESRAHLMRGFSHDVKNPLGAADGYLQLLQQNIYGPLSSAQSEKIDQVRNSLSSALGLIDDLLNLAKAETEAVAVTPAPVNVEEIVTSVVEEFRAQASAAGCNLTVDAHSAPVVQSDAARVRQILGNLLSNAIKYAPGGLVHIRARPCSSPPPARMPAVAIAVRDSGPGIPRVHWAKLFDEFTRFDEGSSEGAGVGLAISRKLARALGGDITVESRMGHGSAFTFWLPVTP